MISKASLTFKMMGFLLIVGFLAACASDKSKTHNQQVNTEIENLRLEEHEQQEEKTDGGIIAPAMFDPHPSDVTSY